MRTLCLVALLSVAAPLAAEDALPRRVDLRPQLDGWGLPPRPQGKRNTCSVFVTVGAYEFACARRDGRGTPLSVEYANWACNQLLHNTTRDRGQFFHDLVKGIEVHGLCREDLMPYEARFANSTPSAAARQDAARRRDAGYRVQWIRAWSKTAGLDQAQFDAIRRTLARGWPVCAGSGHSRLLVGYLDDPRAAGGGTFFTRDSGPGAYAEVSYEWIRSKVFDLFWVEPVR